MPSRPDPHSYARPAEARVTHVALDLAVDFEARRLRGRAALDLNVAPGSTAVVLDTRDLHLRAVADHLGHPLDFTLGEPDPVLGRALSVVLPAGSTRIVIEYETSPDAAALQWLTPDQTAGRRYPFVFSQGHAILTRSWIPTQDSPGIRQTYEARIRVPRPLAAVMSAEQLTPGGVPSGDDRRFEFRMREPIPPHLFALAVGDIAFRPVGPRTGVFAEPDLVDRAHEEFADLEHMLVAAEEVGGPYRWGRFDVLVLPPSFPFGGMENPRVAFITPTLLAGDRSLTTVVAHELAHGWAGNLVTNATWSDFWLNEGFTVYMELRITEALRGAESAAALEVYGHRELAAQIDRLGATSPDTKLYLDLEGRDPAEGLSTIPYVKGAAFLRVLEQAVGRERFDRYLRSWFDRHAFRSVTTEAFVSDVRAVLLDGDTALERQIDVERWIYEPGLPENVIHPVSDLLTAVEARVAAFAAGEPARSLGAERWSAQQWRHFLDALPRELSESQLRDLDATFELSGTGNGEILFAWLRLAVGSRYEPAMPALERFLIAQGRRKFIVPLYEALMTTEWGVTRARRAYQEARPLYHSFVRAKLDAVVR